MLAEQRYKEISEILEREGSVKTVTLCGILGTSRETVRRDLETMEERNMLKRIHGGAMRMEPAVAETIVIADSSKLGVNSLVRMCGVEEISRLITDSGRTSQCIVDISRCTETGICI